MKFIELQPLNIIGGTHCGMGERESVSIGKIVTVEDYIYYVDGGAERRGFFTSSTQAVKGSRIIFDGGLRGCYVQTREQVLARIAGA